ncbi:hypothetical protein CUR178_00598 [Leishmania enriettii]|uniref:Uncharacterized protein n=1 Tax=Leishmania enriettii TaxID=5663 RepID=A0A836GX85_LEIEN|nr:hypothetical protein CUR178_00598 [Leishmania enriettii]
MLTRTTFHLWTPRYFRGQAGRGRHFGKRRLRALDAAPTPCSTEAVKGGEAVAPPRILTLDLPPQKSTKELPPEHESTSPSVGRTRSQAWISGQRSPPPAVLNVCNPLVRHSQQLLDQLATVDDSQSSVSPDAARGFVEFSARRDVLGPLRGLLPLPARSFSGGSADLTPRDRFRLVPVVSSSSSARAPDPQLSTAADFSLSDLVLFLRLYDSANVADGQVLAQLLSEIRRHLFALAETEAAAAANRDASATRSVAGTTTDEENLEAESRGVTRMLPVPSSLPLPLPTMLYTMSSLGIVEEDLLDVIAGCAMRDGVRQRRGLLYSQVRLYSVRELLELLVALQRFGHQQQPSTKSVMKALRASLYSTPAAASRFHKRARAFKKTLAARSRSAAGGEGHLKATAAEDDSDGVAAMMAADGELSSLAFGLECPLRLLLEALTATATSVHRRADVVAFLSDLIAVTAVAELATAVYEGRRGCGLAGREELAREADGFVLATSHQLLRAAKLTESMELPQILLSSAFAWSTTLTGRGVIVNGGEDNAVPSDRVAYYDHVTADLIKANSAE